MKPNVAIKRKCNKPPRRHGLLDAHKQSLQRWSPINRLYEVGPIVDDGLRVSTTPSLEIVFWPSQWRWTRILEDAEPYRRYEFTP